MKKDLIKQLSIGVVFSLLIGLITVAAGAMFLTDDKEELFGLRKNRSTQAMEIQGTWLGMKLTSTDTPTASRFGIPPSERGVMIVEINEREGWRARLAGVQRGDVIKSVNGKKVRDMADLYDISRDLDIGSAVSLDILRWGQLMTLVLPAMYAPPPLGAQPQAGQGLQAATVAGQRVNPGAAVNGAQGPLFYCYTHNQVWPQNAVHPHYRCLMGNCPLNRVR